MEMLSWMTPLLYLDCIKLMHSDDDKWGFCWHEKTDDGFFTIPLMSAIIGYYSSALVMIWFQDCVCYLPQLLIWFLNHRTRLNLDMIKIGRIIQHQSSIQLRHLFFLVTNVNLIVPFLRKGKGWGHISRHHPLGIIFVCIKNLANILWLHQCAVAAMHQSLYRPKFPDYNIWCNVYDY